MWPLPNINNKLITVNFTNKNITCSIIRPNKSGYRIYAYKNICYSGTTIKRPYSSIALQEITSFLSTYNAHNSFASFSIEGPGISQKLLSCTTAQPTVQTLHKEDPLEKTIRHVQYLYGTPEGLFIFYGAAISRELLFQYQLLALQLKLHLLTITPSFQTVLTVYKYLYGTAFRQVQLAADMQHLHNNLDAFFTLPIFNQMIKTMPACNKTSDLPTLISLFGLYLAEREHVSWIK